MAEAGSRVLTYEGMAGGPPDHVLFQSWTDKPDRVLPETDPTTFTGLVDGYFDDRAALGQVPGEPVNLALGRKASASASIAGSEPSRAIDGDADTLWSAGAGPPAWIQVDLGAAHAVSEIRLVISQYSRRSDAPPRELRNGSRWAAHRTGHPVGHDRGREGP